MWERKEVQEVLRCLTPVDFASESHTRTRRFRTDPSAPRKLNLRKQVREDGANRDGLHYKRFSADSELARLED